MADVRYTDKNIEDWDFRSYRGPLLRGGLSYGDPMVLFLASHWGQVLKTDCLRLPILNSLIDNDQATLTPDGDVMLTPFGEEVLPYMTSPRDALSQSGRENRRIVKSLVREWDKYGRLRYTILPADLSESFPGLFDSDDPDDPVDPYASLARLRADCLHDLPA
jgi:hypothetical protein